MIIGPVGSGKTTLLKILFGSSEEVHKTQAVEFNNESIDTPGEFFENPRLYRYLIATSVECFLILIVQDASNPQAGFPTGFSAIFPREVIGVVTKIDSSESDVPKAKQILLEMGITEPVFLVSSYTGEGITILKEYINAYRID